MISSWAWKLQPWEFDCKHTFCSMFCKKRFPACVVGHKASLYTQSFANTTWVMAFFWFVFADNGNPCWNSRTPWCSYRSRKKTSWVATGIILICPFKPAPKFDHRSYDFYFCHGKNCNFSNDIVALTRIPIINCRIKIILGFYLYSYIACRYFSTWQYWWMLKERCLITLKHMYVELCSALNSKRTYCSCLFNFKPFIYLLPTCSNISGFKCSRSCEVWE